MRRALAIDEKSYGPDHPKVAIRLNNLAQLLQATKRLSEAEPLMRRALEIDEQSYGADHPNVARDLNNLVPLLSKYNAQADLQPPAPDTDLRARQVPGTAGADEVNLTLAPVQTRVALTGRRTLHLDRLAVNIQGHRATVVLRQAGKIVHQHVLHPGDRVFA